MSDAPTTDAPGTADNLPVTVEYAKREPPWRMTGKQASAGIFVVLPAICAVVGIKGLLGLTEDTGNAIHRCENRAAVLQAQLKGIAERLGNYKTIHGRYPTNDEGLGALDPLPDRASVCVDYPPSLCSSLQWGRRLPEDLRSCRNKAAGAGTAMMEEVQTSILFRATAFPASWSKPPFERLDVEVDAGNELYLRARGGVLEPSLVPYGYENRNGCAANAFTGSPVDGDVNGDYSVRVDSGIYVYSLGAMANVRECQRVRLEHALAVVGWSLLFLPPFACFVYLVRRRAWVGVVLLVTGTAVGAQMAPDERATCYIPAPLFRYRPPELVDRQQELLQRYRDAGVITQATFDRLMDPTEYVPATTAGTP
ncbi:MAG: hypothetical protein GX591_03440 [Planctomycetes bacterium]|nr:hypothetical protein [Planctomycetota bacterium]